MLLPHPPTNQKKKQKNKKYYHFCFSMAEAETGTPTASAPATPGTPGGPLFSSLRVDSLSYDRKSMPRCKCLPVGAASWAPSPTCFTDFPAPDVSLTRKVRGLVFISFSLIQVKLNGIRKKKCQLFMAVNIIISYI